MNAEHARGALVMGLMLAAAGPAAHALPVFGWSGSAQGDASYYTSGPTSCNYYNGQSTSNCNIQSIGAVPLTYNSYSAQGYLPYPDFAGVSTAFSASASSSGDANGLHADASVSVTNNPYIPGFTGSYYDINRGGGGSATATVDQTDTITPTPPANWSGGPFYMAFTFSVDGEVQTALTGANAISYTSLAYAQIQFNIGNSSGTYNGGAYNQSFDLPTTILTTPANDFLNGHITTAPMKIVSLSAFYYVFTLQTNAKASCITEPDLGLCDAYSFADLSDTATLSGIEFEDANGNPIPGFSLNSSSGTNYNQLITSNTAAAPEPGTFPMLAGAAVLLAAVLRRRVFLA